MKTTLTILGLALGWVMGSPAAQGAVWLTDLAAAQARAEREGKTVLLNFTGSDWCGWCVKLKKEVFSQLEFNDFAAQHLVLVEVDFPKQIPQSAALKKANRDLAQRFQVGGFPTLVLLSPQGTEIGRHGYQPGGAAPFVRSLAKMVGVHPSSSPASAERPAKPLPLYGGAAIAPPPTYDQLELKSISGSKKRRFALLNNQTFSAGETARVKLGQGEVSVKCLEIRDDSVSVLVLGEKEPRVIPLQEGKKPIADSQ